MSKVSLIPGSLILSYHSLSLILSLLEKLQLEELPRPGGVWRVGIQHCCSLGQQGGRAIREQGASQSLGRGCLLSALVTDPSWACR